MELQLSLELVLLLLPVGSMCALPDVLLPKPSIECCCFGRLLPIEPNLAPMAASVVIVLGELVVVVPATEKGITGGGAARRSLSQGTHGQPSPTPFCTHQP